MSKHTRVIGIGSPHGDDRAGWLVATRLAVLSDLQAEILTVLQPIDILDHVADCQRLMVVDAVVSEGVTTGVRRFCWPTEAIAYSTSHSSHGIGVAYTLKLIEQMGLLPEKVLCFAVECGAPALPAGQAAMGDQVLRHVYEAARQIRAEIETQEECPGA